MKYLHLKGCSSPEMRAELILTKDWRHVIASSRPLSAAYVTTWSYGERELAKLSADEHGRFHSFTSPGLRCGLPRDYELPSHVTMGLPVWEEVLTDSDDLRPSLRSHVFGLHSTAGDLVIDWSDGESADAVLVSALEHDIRLCCHYQKSTHRWVGLSLRNVPVTIMNDCQFFGGAWSPRTNLQSEWQRLLRAQIRQ